MLDLQPGDIVCTTYWPGQDPDGPSWGQYLLSLGIRSAECFNDVDGQAQLTHSFFIVKDNGTTFEALWKYRRQNIYEAYAGQEVLIGRHKELTRTKFLTAYYDIVRKYEGQRYPAWKFPLFLLAPRVLKWMPGKPVCSELTFLMLYKAELVDHWRGVAPSYVADAIRRWRDFEIIYQGVMPEKKGEKKWRS